MFLLLIACGSLYLVLGDVGEALLLLGFVFVVVGITFFQERKTERALEALRDLSSPGRWSSGRARKGGSRGGRSSPEMSFCFRRGIGFRRMPWSTSPRASRLTSRS